MVSRNGLSEQDFVDGVNDGSRFIYASSPNRGLRATLRCWRAIRSALLERGVASPTLMVFYGFTRGFEKWAVEHMGDYKLWRRQVEELLDQPGVQCVTLSFALPLSSPLSHNPRTGTSGSCHPNVWHASMLRQGSHCIPRRSASRPASR